MKNKLSILLVISAMLIFSCGEKVLPKISTDSAVEDSVKSYFRQFPIGGGWDARNIEARSGVVEVNVYIPTGEAMKANSSELNMNAVSATSCPSKREELWKTRGLVDIVIKGHTISGEDFVDVSCQKYDR